MIVVKLLHKDASEVMRIVQDVRAMGLIQGTDFDFAFHQAVHDPISGHLREPKHTIFTFYESKWATLFNMKWAS
jgi:hypothetical protein